MASQFQVLASLQQFVTDALTPVIVLGQALQFKCAVGWPPIGALQDVAKAGPALVAIYDRKISKNSTRWAPYIIQQTITEATLTTAIAPNHLAAGASAVITLGGTVTPGDAVSCVAAQFAKTTVAVVAIGGAADTPVSMATQLAGLINNDPTMTGVLTAVASGFTVTVTNQSGVPLALASYAGNGGTQLREIGRRDQQVQIVLWAKTVEIRNAMSAAIEVAIAEAEIEFGPDIDDTGTQSRMTFVSDYDLEDNTLEDVYRHDFMVSMDYPVTITDMLYDVLAPIVDVQVQVEIVAGGQVVANLPV